MSNNAIMPPDCEDFVGLYPSSTQPSWVNYPALNTMIGGSVPFTISAWVRFTGFNPGWTTVISATDSQGNQNPFLQSVFQNGINCILAGINASFQVNDPERKQWYYLTITWDGNQYETFYIDGAPWGTLQASVPQIVNPAFSIGANLTEPPPGINHSFCGDIRNLAVWSVCLSPAEVQQSMWDRTPGVQTSEVLLFTDFTQSPPSAAVGPTPNMNSSAFLMEAACTWPLGPLAPGPATKINPGGSGAFSSIVWVSAGYPFIPSVASAARLAPKDPPPEGTGVLLSNRDQTDAAHFAFLLDQNGTPTAVFGTGSNTQTVAASGTQVTTGLWVCLAITYDGSTCTLYVNGTQVGSGTVNLPTPSSQPAPLLFGRMNNNQPVDTFQGVAQFVSVWNRALSSQEVSSLMYQDPTGMNGCVADFSLGENPPQDLLPLLDASWNQNQLSPASPNASYEFVSAIWGGTTSSLREHPTTIPLSTKPLKINFQKPMFRCPPNSVHPFSEAHKELIRKELRRFLGSIQSGFTRRALLKEFDQQMEEVFAAAQRGKLPPLPITVKTKGNLIEVTDNATGEIISRFEVDFSPKCAAWWVTFIYTFINGILTFLGLPTPAQRLVTYIQNNILNDPVVLGALLSVQGLTLSGGMILKMLKVLYDAGYLMTIVKMAASSLSWWGLAWVLAKLIPYVLPVPNPQQALFIANCLVILGQLVLQIQDYQNECGSGEE